MSEYRPQILGTGPYVRDRWSLILGSFSEDRVLLLVIGARRRSPLGKVLLGSAAHSIILDANVSVLVVRDKAEPI